MGVNLLNSKFIIVSEDPALIHKGQLLGQQMGLHVKVYSPSQWEEKVSQSTPSLASGTSTVSANIVSGKQSPSSPQKVIQFPFTEISNHDPVRPIEAVESIHEIEARAIENAILVFRGNLTEAAKALGIGRATLYRKVKQYNIDPSIARRKKVA